jgi:hypothetical protein
MFPQTSRVVLSTSNAIIGETIASQLLRIDSISCGTT